MSKSFDFVVEAKEVIIKEKCHNKYQVKMAGVCDFIKYQTWSSTNTNNVNGKRSVSLVNVKNWVKDNFPKKNLFTITTGPMFTPTTVMEVGNKKYIFVIESATYNKNKKYNTVLNVSTSQIVKNNSTKNLVKLPVNKKLNNVRFDIDSIDSSNTNTVQLFVTKITQIDSSYGTGTTIYSCNSGGITLTICYNTDTDTNNVLSFTIPSNTNYNSCSSENGPWWTPNITLSDIFKSEYYSGASYDEKTNTLNVNNENGFTFVLT
jgi:hypothetical protein